MTIPFAKRQSIEQVEEGNDLAPKFDANGLIPVVTTDYTSGELLMHAYMNDQALRKTIETSEAHYYSRSRQKLWRKGETSGLIQSVKQLLIDDDQDCIWMRVTVATGNANNSAGAVGGNVGGDMGGNVGGNVGGGGSCHVGYRSCFYRAIPTGDDLKNTDDPIQLTFTETEKVFDPKDVYGDAPNPTQL